MATKINVPIPQDKIGESFVWRDWFQKLSNKVYGSLASQDANAVAITGGIIDGTTIGATTASTGHFTSVQIDTPLPIASGGTNNNATPTAGAVAYGTGTAYAFTSVGTAGQVLTSAGSSVPTWSTYIAPSAVVTKTADFTLAATENWVINNKTTTTCTVTLPAASSWSGRSVTFKNLQAQTLVSASSNVVPIGSTTAGTAILLAVVGNWATLVSDGTNWVTMQTAPNNILLLE